MIIVSSCLAGMPCRYDGTAKPNERVVKLVKQGLALPICPECLGGLSTPRPPAEIRGGSGEDVLAGRAEVISRAAPDGVESNVTKAFIDGAVLTLNKARACNAEYAILKAFSPSCGFGCIYDGSFSGAKRDGNGVAAALLIKNGIKIESL